MIAAPLPGCVPHVSGYLQGMFEALVPGCVPGGSYG